MADQAHEETDKKLEELEKKIIKEYEQAKRETHDKLVNFMRKFEEERTAKLELVEKGELSKEEYDKWCRNKIFMSRRWHEMRATLAEDLVNADIIAMSMVGDHMPDVYALNHNYGTFEAETGAMMDTSYTLYDRQTVERLIRDEPDLLPMPKVDISKDRRWNKQHVTSAITQGILQGESIPKIAKRLEGVTDMDRRAAIRNARTMTTSAENAGRVASYERAKSFGIKMSQIWLATTDGRTRHEHRFLNGQEVEVGKPFEVFGEKIRYPGDPEAAPHLVYNCRCTLIAQVGGIDYGLADITSESAELGGDSYQNWVDRKQKEEKQFTKAHDLHLLGKHASKPLIDAISLDNNKLSRVMMMDTGVEREQAQKYVDRIQAWAGNEHRGIRTYQQGQARDEFAKEYFKTASEVLENYIETAPKWNGGTTYRGTTVDEDFLNTILSGEVFDAKGTSSWTTDINVAKDHINEGGIPVILECETQSKGCSIMLYSLTPYDYEVLVSKKSKYKMDKARKVDGIWRIKVKEINT